MLNIDKLSRQQLINLIKHYSEYVRSDFDPYGVETYYERYYKKDRELGFDEDTLSRIYSCLEKYIANFSEDAILNLDSRICEDLWLDDLDEIELILSLEEEFSIEITDAVWYNAKTVEDIYSIVKKLI